jgi:hypothetical protein
LAATKGDFVRGARQIAAAALGTALACGLVASGLAAAAGGRSTASLVTLEVAPRGPGSISTDTPGFDLDAGNDTTPISGPCTNSEGEGECHWGFSRGTPVKLTANPTGDGLNGWSSPDCPGTGSCTITVNDDVTTIVGQFNPLTLGVRLSSDNVGTVTSYPAGIDCSVDFDTGCFHDFKANTPVQLTVTGGDFKGWSGRCLPADQRTCTVVVDDQKTWAGVTFDGDVPPVLETTINVLLKVRKLGGGGGTVTATDIACGAQCTRRLTFGDTVTLTAQPDGTSTFNGWGGLCAQTQRTCKFPVGPITQVEVKFNRDATPPIGPPNLKVSDRTRRRVTVSWGASKDNVGVATYRVYKDDTPVGDVTATRFTIPGLACGHTYAIAVDAVDAAGNRSPKSIRRAATKPCRLAARVTGVGVHRSGSKRTVVVQLRVNRKTTVLLAVRSNGRKVFGARYKIHRGTNELRLVVGRLVAAGPYRLGVKVIDPDGRTPQVFSRGILLPKPR